MYVNQKGDLLNLTWGVQNSVLWKYCLLSSKTLNLQVMTLLAYLILVAIFKGSIASETHKRLLRIQFTLQMITNQSNDKEIKPLFA